MNSGESAGLGGPLKKPVTKPAAGKPLGGGLGSGGKSIGGEAPAPTAPPAPLAFEFDDAPAAKPEPKKPTAAPAAFNPFDEPVAVPTAASATAPAPTAPTTGRSEKSGTGRVEKPGTARVEKPGTGRVEKPGTGRMEKPGTGRIETPGTGRMEKPGTGTTVKPPVVDTGDGDIAPGLAKDLWLCPHCGAKNKPHRETCRECKKSPADAVEKPWFLNPVIIGPIAGGLVLVIILFVMFGGTDLSLHPAGVPDSKVRSVGIPQEEIPLGDTRSFTAKRTAAVSGRVIFVTDYAVAPWMQAVVVGLGSSASDDATFSTWSAEFDGDGIAVKAPRYATLFLINDSKAALKPGDWLSVVGKAGVAEQDHVIVKGSDNPNCWTIQVKQIETR